MKNQCNRKKTPKLLRGSVGISEFARAQEFVRGSKMGRREGRKNLS